MNNEPNQSMTYEEIADTIYELELDVIDLEKQLEMYAAQPKNPQWPAKARAALKIKRLQIADLHRRQDLMRNFARIEGAFVESARLLLTPDLFSSLMVDAKERMLG
jgi:hypothetical protein